MSDQSLPASAGRPSNRYRTKPVVKEAWQFDGSWTSARPIIALSSQMSWGSSPGDSIGEIEIETLEGTMTASPGDWIIRGIKGEFYPCKPDVFAVTYEPVPTDGASKPPEQERGEERLTDARLDELAYNYERNSFGGKYSAEVGNALRELEGLRKIMDEPSWRQSHRAAAGREEIREANETIRELQRDLCAYAGVPLPSERERFDAVRAKTIEEVANAIRTADGPRESGANFLWYSWEVEAFVRSLKPTHEG